MGAEGSATPPRALPPPLFFYPNGCGPPAPSTGADQDSPQQAASPTTARPVVPAPLGVRPQGVVVGGVMYPRAPVLRSRSASPMPGAVQPYPVGTSQTGVVVERVRVRAVSPQPQQVFVDTAR